MIPLNQKNVGAILVGFSIILLVILTFIKIDVDKQGLFLCELVSEDPSLKMEDCPVHKTNTSWFIVVSFGLAFLILGIGLYNIFVPARQEEKKKQAADVSKLDSDEKSVHALLLQHEGSMYQSDLIRETGFSKVKMTRILDKMVSKKIVERKRRGMTNIVVLL